MSIQSRNLVVIREGAIRNPRKADSPTSHDYQLLLERRGAEANGYEVPLDSIEAAAYIGSSLSNVISLARAGEIPAHRVAEEAWIFYVPELNGWLAENACRRSSERFLHSVPTARNRT